jgi:transposase-like protein
MKHGKRKADAFKGAAVELMLASARTQKEIAADIGVDPRTLRRWQRDRERLGPDWIRKLRDDKLVVGRLRRENALLRREVKLMATLTRFSAEGTR